MVCTGPFEGGRNLFGATRAHHCQRHSGIGIEGAVLPVRGGDIGIGDDGALTEDGGEGVEGVPAHIIRAVAPASIGNTVPVICELASSTRNSTARVTSSGLRKGHIADAGTRTRTPRP